MTERTAGDDDADETARVDLAKHDDTPTQDDAPPPAAYPYGAGFERPSPAPEPAHEPAPAEPTYASPYQQPSAQQPYQQQPYQQQPYAGTDPQTPYPRTPYQYGPADVATGSTSGVPASTIAQIVVSAILVLSCGLALIGLPSLVMSILAATRAGRDPAAAARLTRWGWFTMGALAVLGLLTFVVVLLVVSTTQ